MVLSVLAVVIFGIIVVLIGVYGYKFSKKTVADYMLAGRDIGKVVLFFYISMVLYSAWTIYGYPGILYLHGPPYVVFALSAHAAFAFVYFGIGPRMWGVGKLYGYASPLEFLEHRYESPWVRILTAVVLLAFIVPYVGIQAVGAGAGFNSFLGLPYSYGAIYISLLMAAVVIMGGMRTVAWLNVFLGSIFFVAFVGSLLWVIKVALPGGLTEAAQIVLAKNPEALSAPGPSGIWTPKAIFGLVVAGLTTAAWPHVMVGTMTARNVQAMRTFAILFLTLAGIFFYSFPTIYGSLVGPALIHGLVGKQADAVLQIVVGKFLPMWFGTFVLMAVVAAAMSTAGTQLMVSGVFISRDVLSKFTRREVSDAQMINWTRLSLFLVIFASLVLAFLRPTELGLFLTNIASPGFTQWLPLLLGALFWKRGNKYGAIAGLISGVVMLVAAWIYKPVALGFPPVVMATAVNTFMYLVVSLATAPVSENTKAKFFDALDDYLDDLARQAREKDLSKATGHSV